MTAAPLPVSLAVFLAQAAENTAAPAPATTAAPATTTVTTATGTPAPAPSTQPPPSVLPQLVPFLFIAVIFYFLLIRPQQLRAKQQAALISSIKSGDEVLTNSGIYGTITNVNPERKTVTVRIADNVKVVMARDAVSTVLNKSGDASGAVSTSTAAKPVR